MTIHLLSLHGIPIIQQLQLEEALLRTDNRNFCIINTGAPRAIVMGISGKREELISDRAQNIPIIRRFSGGGTVIVDEETIFVSFIFNASAFPFSPFPEPILRWTETVYKPVLQHSGFRVRENDYAIGEKKCGGNAQYLSKTRFVHHTTFLWDFKKENMEYLLFPKRRPAYRGERSHEEFLCTLKEFIPSKENFISRVSEELKNHFAQIVTVNYEEVQGVLAQEHRKSTHLV